MRTRRGGVYSPEFRTATVARGARPGGQQSHLAEQLPPIKPYIYGASSPATRPEVREERRTRRPRRVIEQVPEPVVEQDTRLRDLQRTYRPLTTAELIPGLWVEQIVETESRCGNYSTPGLLAADRREPARLVLWASRGGGLVRSHFVLGPSYPRDDSMPVHEIWPVDPDFFSPEQQELLTAYAEQAVYNRDIGEFEITA